jgi:hypothetical protein
MICLPAFSSLGIDIGDAPFIYITLIIKKSHHYGNI